MDRGKDKNYIPLGINAEGIIKDKISMLANVFFSLVQEVSRMWHTPKTDLPTYLSLYKIADLLRTLPEYGASSQ